MRDSKAEFDFGSNVIQFRTLSRSSSESVSQPSRLSGDLTALGACLEGRNVGHRKQGEDKKSGETHGEASKVRPLCGVVIAAL